jgi:flagellar hook-associated protein 1 FlgK
VADGIPANDDLNTLGFVSYARLIDVAITDPRKIAAARDTNPANGVIGFQPGNSENLRALYDTRNQQRNFSAGTFSRITTYDENYNELLSSVGNTRSASRVNLSVAETNFEIAQNRREQLSGVSLDEEFSQLILYQKAYEASARMIKVAQQLIDEVVNLI